MEADYLAAQAVLDRARAAGITLEATPEGLAFDGPTDQLADLLDDLRAHKAGILEILRDVAKIPPATPEDWPPSAAEGTMPPSEWGHRQEPPASARLRKRAFALRTGKSTLPSTDGLPTNAPRPCDRCGNADLTPTPCHLGARWECFAPTCRIAGDRGRTWWVGRTIYISGPEAGQ